jgi:hypothetical protein
LQDSDGFENGFDLDGGIDDLLGQDQDIPNSFLLLCQGYAFLPLTILPPESLRDGRPQRARFRLWQTNQEIEQRALYGSLIRGGALEDGA